VAMNSRTSVLVLWPVLICTTSYLACKRPAPQASTVTLSVTLNPKCTHGNGPPGNGVVTLTPAPQSPTGNCNLVGDNPVNCGGDYVQGTVVTLTAVPDPRTGPGGVPISTFETFQGISNCSAGAKTCQLPMDTGKQVTAVFCSLIH
jgi:hypothetical protein